MWTVNQGHIPIYEYFQEKVYFMKIVKSGVL
jgi:hypothetical protein